MAERPLSINKIKWFKLLVLVLLFLIAVLVVYFPDYAKLRKLRQENKRLSDEIRKLKIEIADYEEKIGKLGSDPYLYEKIARDNLGVAKENEIVIDIEE